MSDERLLQGLGSRPKILVIRRDNIGDLVCTTPMIAALRERFPNAYLAALVNAYNAPVLAGNPALDAVFHYDKAKHAAAGASRLRRWLERWRLIRRLRCLRFDLVILATPAPTRHWFRLAQLVGAHDVLAALTPGGDLPHSVTVAVSLPANLGTCHAVEQNWSLLDALGIHGRPGPAHVYADTARLAKIKSRLTEKFEPFGQLGAPVIGLHISARKPGQRWPAERFVELARALHAQQPCLFILFWSPGSETNPQHPGDDEKAANIVAATGDLPLLPWPTQTLPELIAGLAALDRLVCSDGGAMHLAAALGKPIVCLFGNSDPAVWHPWGVAHRLIQPLSRAVADVTVDEVRAALNSIEVDA